LERSVKIVNNYIEAKSMIEEDAPDIAFVFFFFTLDALQPLINWREFEDYIFYNTKAYMSNVLMAKAIKALGVKKVIPVFLTDPDGKKGEELIGKTTPLAIVAGDYYPKIKKILNSTATLLLADDEENLLLLYKEILEEQGYEVILANNGKKAIELFKEQAPDLAVLDIRMPGMDGLDVMHDILRENRWIPVILNSAYTHYKLNFLSWSADAYVVKSVYDPTLKELRKVIFDLLERGQKEKQQKEKK